MRLLDAASRIGLCPMNVKPPAVPGDIYCLCILQKKKKIGVQYVMKYIQGVKKL